MPRVVVIERAEDGGTDALFVSLRKGVLSRFARSAQRAVQLPGEVNVLLANDARLKVLNRAYRGKNKPTDVLSFPAAEFGGMGGDEAMAGDLAISVETAARQAAEHGHSLEAELRVLILHGMLHLAGYDHEADEGEMRALESQLRAKLKLPVGLIERTARGGVKRTSAAALTRGTSRVRGAGRTGAEQPDALKRPSAFHGAKAVGRASGSEGAAAGKSTTARRPVDAGTRAKGRG